MIFKDYYKILGFDDNKATVEEMFDRYYDATQEKLYKFTNYSK